jgi:hypothetical protein
LAEEKDRAAIVALLELGRQTKEIVIEDQELVIKRLSFGQEQNIANHVGEMEQKGIPSDTCQREYAKQVVVSGTVSPKIDELVINDIPFPLVTKIAREILNFSSGLEKN